MHKFLLAENPQAPGSGGLWIIHMPDPICIIEAVLEGEKIQTPKVIHKKEFEYVSSDGVSEHWQLRLYHYFTTDFNEEKEAEELAEKIIIRAWRWYKEYLIWEDQIIDDDYE